MPYRLSVLLIVIGILSASVASAQDTQLPGTTFGETREEVATNPNPIRAFAGVGLGMQYGFLGTQAGLQWKRVRLRGALGFGGITAGLDLVPTKKLSVGVQTFYSYFWRGNGVNVNYYFEDARRGGWSVGLDLTQLSGHSSSDDSEFGDRDARLSVLVSVGFIR